MANLLLLGLTVVLQLVMANGALGASAGGEAAEVPEVLVTQNRSILRYSPGYWSWNPFHHNESLCTTFYVSSRNGEVKDVAITSTGLGLVKFKLDEPAFSGSGCPTSTEGEHLQLLIPTLNASRRILMRVPGNELPELGNSIEGKILVVNPKQKPQEIPFKVDNPSSSFRTAWLWFWGILIPAALTFSFGYLAVVANNWFTTRKTDSENFRKYKDENRDKLEKFFTGPYAVTLGLQKDDAFAQGVLSDLMSEKVLAALPKHKRRKLEKEISRCSRTQIMKALAELFPEWKAKISSLTSEQVRELDS